MNRFCLIIFLLLTTTSNADAKNCDKGKPCGNSCIARNKVCHGGGSSGSSSSSSRRYSSEDSSSYIKNCKTGKLCGNTCIAIDKECYIGELSGYLSSSYSYGNISSIQTLPKRNYSYSAKPQIAYECNGILVSESEYKNCKPAQQSNGGNKDLTDDDDSKKQRTHSTETKIVVAAKILDADIFQCADKKQQKIKLYGIDAPEDGQPFHQEAKSFLEKLILKKR